MKDQEVHEEDPFLCANQEVEATCGDAAIKRPMKLDLANYGTNYEYYDTELLAKLCRKSNISQCTSNQVKGDRWKKITRDYCNEKKIPLIPSYKLQRKWSRMVKTSKTKSKLNPSKINLELENKMEHSPVVTATDFEPKNRARCRRHRV